MALDRCLPHILWAKRGSSHAWLLLLLLLLLMLLMLLLLLLPGCFE